MLSFVAGVVVVKVGVVVTVVVVIACHCRRHGCVFLFGCCSWWWCSVVVGFTSGRVFVPLNLLNSKQMQRNKKHNKAELGQHKTQ